MKFGFDWSTVSEETMFETVDDDDDDNDDDGAWVYYKLIL